jgi:hypothetical protein
MIGQLGRQASAADRDGAQLDAGDVGDVGDARKNGPPRRAAKPPDARQGRRTLARAAGRSPGPPDARQGRRTLARAAGPRTGLPVRIFPWWF